jgi:quinol-cytochrome oxidoreductase complex cytochrome b subunit
VVGNTMKQLLLAGDGYNVHTLPRFFVLHGAVLPVTMILLIIMHLGLMRLQGVSELEFEDEAEPGGTFKFFPDHIMSELVIGLLQANPLVTPEVIKPEWFFYVAFRWLKLFSGVAAVLSTGFIVFVMFIWPFIDAGIRKVWPKSEASVWIGIVGAGAIIALTIWEAAVAH